MSVVGGSDFAPDVTPAPGQQSQSLLRINAIGLYTIVAKEISRVTRIWVQTLIPPAITMTLYFVIFGSLIGRRIGEMDGIPYTTFIAPGLIMMAVITNSFGNVVSSFFSSKLQMHLEEMLVAPLSYVTIVFGYVIGGVARGLTVAALVTVVAMFFTDLTLKHPLITLVVIVLTAMNFALAGLVNAIWATKFDDISIFPTFVLTPMTYLGGVFFSISLLGPIWQKLALINPVLYMVNAFRYGMLGVSDISIGVAFVIIVAFFIGLLTTALLLLRRGVGIRT